MSYNIIEKKKLKMDKIDSQYLKRGLDWIDGYWPAGNSKLVEFFPNEFTEVCFVESNFEFLKERLESLVDGNPIALSIKMGLSNPEKIALIQMCTSNGCILIFYKHDSPLIKDFLMNHEFVVFDRVKNRIKNILKKEFNVNFKHINDIQPVLFWKYHLKGSINRMIKNFYAQKPTTDFFNSKIINSDWESKLSIPMILFAGFEVAGLIKLVQNINYEKLDKELEERTQLQQDLQQQNQTNENPKIMQKQKNDENAKAKKKQTNENDINIRKPKNDENAKVKKKQKQRQNRKKDSQKAIVTFNSPNNQHYQRRNQTQTYDNFISSFDYYRGNYHSNYDYTDVYEYNNYQVNCNNYQVNYNNYQANYNNYQGKYLNNNYPYINPHSLYDDSCEENDCSCCCCCRCVCSCIKFLFIIYVILVIIFAILIDPTYY